MPFPKPNVLYFCGKSSKYRPVWKNTMGSYDFVGPCYGKGYSSNSMKSTTKKVENSISGLKESVTKNYLNLTNSMKERIFNNNLYLLFMQYTGQDKAEMAKYKVTEAKDNFIKMQQDRRSVQKELSDIQNRLKAASAELEKTNRGERRYLELFKAEHEIIIEETELMTKLKESDELERSNFLLLGDAISQSHEAQNEKDEKMKKVNLMTTVGSVIVGSVSLMYYYKRCKELHSTVQSFTENQKNMESIISQLTASMDVQNNKTEEFLQDLKTGIENYPGSESVLDKNTNNSNSQTKSAHQSETVQSAIQKQEQILQDIKEMKLMLGLKKSKDNETNVVYVGNDLENILKRTENNIEWKMKMNSLATVAFVYGALALAIPVIIAVFGGGN